MKLKNTRLLFLYRSFLFRFVKFETDNKDLYLIAHALNIKDHKNNLRPKGLVNFR